MKIASWYQNTASKEKDLRSHTSNASIWEAEAGRVPGQSSLHSQLQDNQRYLERACIKEKEKEQKTKNKNKKISRKRKESNISLISDTITKCVRTVSLLFPLDVYADHKRGHENLVQTA